MKLTNNFKLSEFNCKCGDNVPDHLLNNVNALAFMLQRIRDHFKAPVTINSGYRSPRYNMAIGGASRSFHVSAMAADITIKGCTPVQVLEGILYLINTGQIVAGGVKAYETFVHYDIRGSLTLF